MYSTFKIGALTDTDKVTSNVIYLLIGRNNKQVFNFFSLVSFEWTGGWSLIGRCKCPENARRYY